MKYFFKASETQFNWGKEKAGLNVWTSLFSFGLWMLVFFAALAVVLAALRVKYRK